MDLSGRFSNVNLFWILAKRKRRRVQLNQDFLFNSLNYAHINLIGICTSAILSVMLKEEREVWIKPKANFGYWERVLLQWTDSDYPYHLRVQRVTFELLCEKLSISIKKKITHWRIPISVKCRLAIALWRLGRGIDYRSLGEHFGLGKSTVHMITMEVCESIVAVLMPSVVKFPKHDSIGEVAMAFAMEKGMPNCVGAIDGCHIAIPKPQQNGEDYWNRKSFYSINMQAVVDQTGRFIDVNIGWPGKAHDARVLFNSDLYKKAENGQLLPKSTTLISGRVLPYYLIGDSAYPLKSWLMKPFPDNTTNVLEQNFNKRLCGARRVVEQAFGRLKHRWRSILKRCDASEKNAIKIIGSCVTLHNLCESCNDFFDIDDTDQDEMDRMRELDSSITENDATDDTQIRDFLKNYLC